MAEIMESEALPIPEISPENVAGRDRINFPGISISSIIAVFTFGTAHTAIMLEIFVFKQI